MIDIEQVVRNPISEQELNTILSKPSYRSDFINKYTFFKVDGHMKIYKNFIDQVDFKNNNETLDDAIVLADSIDYCSGHLLNLIKGILFSKKNYFIKLSCLDYLLSQNGKIDHSTYMMLNERFKNNLNEFLKLQANINLLITENKSEQSVIRIVKSAHYPDIFYRFFNSISFNSSSFKNHLNSDLIYSVYRIFESHNFPQATKSEIKRIFTFMIQDFER